MLTTTTTTSTHEKNEKKGMKTERKQSVCRTWCVTINCVMNERDSIRSTPVIFNYLTLSANFLLRTHFLAGKNQEFLIVEFSFIRRECHWQRPKKKNPESDIFYFFFFFSHPFLDFRNVNLLFRMRQLCLWVMSSAPGCGETCSTNNKKERKTVEQRKYSTCHSDELTYDQATVH